MITKHSKKVDCQSKLLQNENQPEFQPTDVTFSAPSRKPMFLERLFIYFYKGWGFKHFTNTVYYNYYESTNGCIKLNS